MDQLLRLVYLSASWIHLIKVLFLTLSLPPLKVENYVHNSWCHLPFAAHALRTIAALGCSSTSLLFPTALSHCLLYLPLPTFQQKTQTWNMIISLFVFLLCTAPLEVFHPRPHPGARMRGPLWSWPALLVGRPM